MEKIFSIKNIELTALAIIAFIKLAILFEIILGITMLIRMFSYYGPSFQEILSMCITAFGMLAIQFFAIFMMLTLVRLIKKYLK